MASAEAGRPGQYVKLRKEEKDGDVPVGTEDIRPGELNQPIRVPKVYPSPDRSIDRKFPARILVSSLIRSNELGFCVYLACNAAGRSEVRSVPAGASARLPPAGRRALEYVGFV